MSQDGSLEIVPINIYASYVVERMGLCITSTSNIINQIHEYVSGGHLLLKEREVIGMYKQQLAELDACLRELSKEWLMFLEVAETAHSSVAYRASVDATSRRGRPRIEVSTDQIEYLRSLCSSWTDVSSLLVISRMTPYRHHQQFGLGRDTGTPLDGESVERSETRASRYRGENDDWSVEIYGILCKPS